MPITNRKIQGGNHRHKKAPVSGTPEGIERLEAVKPLFEIISIAVIANEIFPDSADPRQILYHRKGITEEELAAIQKYLDKYVRPVIVKWIEEKDTASLIHLRGALFIMPRRTEQAGPMIMQKGNAEEIENWLTNTVIPIINRILEKK